MGFIAEAVMRRSALTAADVSSRMRNTWRILARYRNSHSKHSLQESDSPKNKDFVRKHSLEKQLVKRNERDSSSMSLNALLRKIMISDVCQ